MRQIGLVGGLSWFSSAEYYRSLNEMVRERLGGHRSARVLLDSVDEQAFIDAQAQDPSEVGCESMVVDSVARLERAGCAVIALCANGLHRFAPAIRRRTGVSVLDIAQATAGAVVGAGLGRVALLGVRATMEGTFYRERLEREGLEVVVPGADDRAFVHQAIVEELTLGRFTEKTRTAFSNLCADLVAGGAEGVVLGCTEIPLLLQGAGPTPFPLFSTTAIHCRAIAEAALAPVPVQERSERAPFVQSVSSLGRQLVPVDDVAGTLELVEGPELHG